MCGIVGYVGFREATELLISGLRRLEYRGYDSAGVAVLDNGEVHVVKSAGRINSLVERLATDPAIGHTGIGHTRWATHGAATDGNAHPHLGGNGAVAVVHNGVIENFRPLKERLQSEGYQFRTATDTEVIAHLIDSCLEKQLAGGSSGSAGTADRVEPLLHAVRTALQQLHGTYGLAILFRDYPDVIIAARLGSPLVVGVGNGEHFAASDVSALAGSTDKIVYLHDHEIAVITPNSLRIVHRDFGHVDPNVQVVEIASGDVPLDGYAHYMQKEIFEQPETVRNAHARPLEPGRSDGHLRRAESLAAAASVGESDCAHGLRHQLARGLGGRIPARRAGADSRRSGICQRAALSESAAGQSNAVFRHHPERRNGRYARGTQGNET